MERTAENNKSNSKQHLRLFIKRWMLPISMLTGAAAYLLYAQIPWPDACRQAVGAAVSVVQPLLIFCMLFVTLCKVDLRQLRPRRWHLPALLLQVLLFVCLALVHRWVNHTEIRIVLEAAMLCLICPTATAAAVVTHKLGGDAAALTAYVMLINLTAALLVPAVVPLLHIGGATVHFGSAFLQILSKVFPLLIGPLLAAVLVRKFLPRLREAITARRDLAFHIWAVALALAIAMTVRSLVNSDVPFSVLASIAIVSLSACALQFCVGRAIGHRHGSAVAASQALGQKNTVLAIWLGFTFFTPVSSLAGGFYSIWHNVHNARQLHRHEKRNSPE